MADRYVWSGASGAGTGADFTNAFTTISAAITAGAAGDTYLVAHDHSEVPATGATRTITFKGTEAAPDLCVAVNRGTGVPVGSPSAIIGVAGAFALYIAGCVTTDGMIWQPGDGAGAGSGERLRFATATGNTQVHRNGRVDFASVNNGYVEIPTSEARVTLDNFVIAGGNANRNFRVGGNSVLTLRNSTPWSSAPTDLFANTFAGETIVEDCDLSAAAAKNLNQTLAGYPQRIRLKNCKLHSTMTVTTPVQRGTRIIMENCSDENGKAINRRYYLGGTVSMERVIVRTGGASNGVDNFSLKLAGNANASRRMPFAGPELKLDIAAADVGVAITATIHVVSDGVTFTDAELWLEGEYLATSGSYKGTLVSDGAATILAAGANQADDSAAAWTTTGLTSPVKQKLEVTFTPQQAGPLRLAVKMAKNATAYICAKVDIT